MKTAFLFLISVLLLSGCSASVRPVYSDTADVTDAMRARADSLGLSLSEHASLILAKGLAQGEKFCSLSNQAMHASVVMKERGSETVPVVHIQCVDEQDPAVEG